MHPLLLAAIRRLDRAEARWSFVRLPANPDAPTGDIDLLVHPEDASKVDRELAALGLAPMPAWGYGSDAFYLAYHAPTEHWIWLHLTQELRFGRYRTLRTDQAEACLARRVCNGDAWILAADDAFWTLLFHCLVDKGYIAEYHRPSLKGLSERARPDSRLAYVYGLIAPPGCGPRTAIALAASEDWQTLEATASRLVPALPQDARRLPLNVAWIRLLRLFGQLRDGRRRGLLVALLGPDGAGKSTLARGIGDSFFFPSRSVYMGVGTGRLSRVANRVGGVRAGGNAVFARPPFTYIAYVTTLWVRYLTGLFHRLRGRLVVFDRYTYDALLPMPAGRSWLKDKALRVQARICPPPDLVLVLDVPGEIMHARKGEFTPQQLEAMRQRLLSLGDRIRHFEVVDATRSAETVRADVVERIWGRYLEKWRGQ